MKHWEIGNFYVNEILYKEEINLNAFQIINEKTKCEEYISKRYKHIKSN